MALRELRIPDFQKIWINNIWVHKPGDSKGLEFDYDLAALAGDFEGSENLEWYFRDRILVIFVTRSQHKATK
jgi:hypothetical protein